ncbi:MAG: tRNA-processing RNAse [Betaproteobacteria bacterium]|nr:tRNA-processing RNAse [Betaproteobacteria bacterium]
MAAKRTAAARGKQADGNRLEAGLDAIREAGEELLDTRQLRYVDYLVRRSVQDQLPQAAGSLTFTTLLSLVPLVTIALGLFAAFPLFNGAKQAIETFMLQNVLPHQASEMIGTYIAEFAESAAKLTTAGLAALAVTAAALMQTIFNAFDAIWRAQRPRPLWRRVLIYWSTITLGPVLIGTGLAITSYLVSSSLGLVAGAAWLNDMVLSLVPIVLTFIAFTLLYFTVPNSDVQLRHAAIGGLAAAVGFELMKHLFGVFVSRFPTYHLIYGTFAAVPIFLMWIYLSWMIALEGALIAATWPLYGYERADTRNWPGTRFIGAMQVLALLLRSREAGGATSRQIRTALRTAYSEAEALLEDLRSANWIGRLETGSHEGRWVLVCDPDTVKVADVFRRFAFDAAQARKRLQGEDPALARGMGEVAAWAEQGLGQTLSQALHVPAPEGGAKPEPRKSARDRVNPVSPIK